MRRSMWLNQYARQFLPIFALLALRGVVGVGTWLASKLGKKKKDAMQEMADELGAHRAKEFNVGVDARKLGECHPKFGESIMKKIWRQVLPKGAVSRIMVTDAGSDAVLAPPTPGT